MDRLYRQMLLEHWKDPKNFGKMKHPTTHSSLLNPSCGDTILMELRVRKGKIQDVKFTGEGCVLSRASASMLTEYMKGKSASQILSLDKTFIEELLGTPITPSRLKCVLLPLEAAQKALHSQN